MAISDADFATWMASDSARRVLLAELKFGYQSAGAPAEGTVYLSAGRYRPYRDCIRSMARVAVKLDPATLTGPSSISVGELVCGNADGQLDFLLDVIVDGRTLTFYAGAEDWSRSDFRAIFATTALGVTSKDRDLTISLSDRRALLDQVVVGRPLGGSGNSAGTPVPLLYGFVLNHEPLLKDSSNLIYAVMDNYADGGLVADVRDSGLSLGSGDTSFGPPNLALFSGTNPASWTANAGTDTMTFAAHGLLVNDVVIFTGTTPFTGLSANTQYWVIAAGLTANDFRVSTTKGGTAVDITGTTFAGTLACYRRRYYTGTFASDGTVQLSAQPSGRVTCDVSGASSAKENIRVFDLMSKLITTFGGIDAAGIDSAAFAAAEAALIAKINPGSTWTVGIGYAVIGRVNLVDALNLISSDGFGWYGQTLAGVVTSGVINIQGLAAAVASRTVTAAEVVEGSFECQNMPIGPSSGTLQYDPQSNIQTDGLATSLDPYFRNLYGTQYKSKTSTALGGTAYTTNWGLYHKTKLVGQIYVSRLVPLSSGANNTYSDATITQKWIDARVGDAAPHNRLVTFKTFLQAWNWGLGDIVKVTYPRHGFAGGVNCALIGVEPDYLEGTVSLTLITKVTPAYTIGSYD
jgi:hypothetical protein